MNWQPTNELRWVVRHFSEPYTDTWNIRLDEAGRVETHRRCSVKTLQQKWIDHPNQELADEEWRDVPVEEEA